MSTSSKKPRVKRKHDVNECYTKSTYRDKAFAKLMDDFERRCAYSLVHVEITGEHNMEVDHHNPTLKGKKLHAYANLYPAYSVCNNAKSGVWPSKREIALRLRFLDPCKEQDYGNHIFEIAATNELVAVTPEGVFHIENCDLNNRWFKNKRRERDEDEEFLKHRNILPKFGADPALSDLLNLLQPITARMKWRLPPIPPPPPDKQIIA